MKRNILPKIVILCAICAATLMSGCLETTTTDEYGTTTYNLVTNETVSAVDCYLDGRYVTGIVSHRGGEDMCYNLYSKVDEYKDGMHVTGYRTLNGCGDNVEWYSCLVATRDGYNTQYLNGYDDAKWCTR